MKTLSIFLLTVFLVGVSACSTGQSNQGKFELSPTEFSQKLKALPKSVILDVRTPEEFSEGALPAARNVDWNGPDFASATANLSKTDPVFVYCLSGGRSASAAAFLRNSGFSQVYEMTGGLMKWRADGLAMHTENADSKKVKGMQMAEFEGLLKSDKTILVDFYADWCGPCKRMKPDLDLLASERAASLTIIRIDADANPDLAKALGVSGLPTLLVYKQKKQVNRKEGYQTKKEMEAIL